MKSLSYKKIITFGLFFSASVSLFDTPNVLALYFFIPIIFLYCITRYKFYYENRYIVILSCLVFVILFSCFSSTNILKSVKEIKALVGTLMMCYIVSTLSVKRDFRPLLYSLWIAYYIGMLAYIPQMDVYNGFDYTKDRLNDSQLNANTIAYHTFYLTFAFYVIGEIVKSPKVKKIFVYLFLFTIPLSFCVALITGSRQVLLVQIPLIIMLSLLRYIGEIKKAGFALFLLIASSVFFYFAAEKVKTVFAQSVLASRYEHDVEKGSRMLLLKDAMNIGFQYPILGVGPGNYVNFSYNRHFSHCTYTELFANCGIFAVFFYVYLMCVFMKKQVIYYTRTKDKLFLSFIIFGIIYAFDNFFYVFYHALWLFPFFFLVASHSEYYYRELLVTRNQETKEYLPS